MKVIFLDIDGVLNNERCWGVRPREKAFAKECVDALNSLTETTEANIVITSSWRNLYEFDELIAILRGAGVKGNIIDRTPPIGFSGGCRGDEILRWLDRASEEERKKINSFVILDDDSDMGYVRDHLVQCDNSAGLTKEDVGKAIAQILTIRK